MEGFKDIYWRGDEVVWENLLKHYLLCLEDVCILLSLGGAGVHIDSNNIPIWRTPENLPTLQYQELHKEIYTKFFADSSIHQLIKTLSRQPRPLRRDELLFYIACLHPYALDTIFAIFHNHNMVSTLPNRDAFQQMAQKTLSDLGKAFDASDEAEKESSGFEDMANWAYSAIKNMMSQMRLITLYNDPRSCHKKGMMFVFSEFPSAYIQRIEKMVYPDWYVACFMAECSNSSVWGHYADRHRGVCLSFKAAIDNDRAFINLQGINGWSTTGPMYGRIAHTFYEIDYEKKYVEVDFFRSLGCLSTPALTKFWYANEDGTRSSCLDDVFGSHQQWNEQYWANFYKAITTKLSDWNYEKEYRLILNSFLLDLGQPARRTLKYDFNDLEAITFGIETRIEDKIKIMQIIESKCRSHKRKHFKFYQAYYSREKGRIDRAELPMIETFADDRETPG
jgi:hypothetical protein